jgi:hypothetical protein
MSVLSPGMRPPFEVLSPNNQGPGVSVATFIVQSVTIFIIILATAKMSVSFLIHKLSPKKNIKLANWSIMGFIAFWTLFSIFSLAFQCGYSNPWIYAPKKCAGQV